MSIDEVRDYYSAMSQREWSRLADPAGGAMEFAVNCHFISTHLPPESRVLDLGGGPGRYTIWLAGRGHQVVLADLSPVMLDIARQQIASSPDVQHVEGIVEADARDLSRWPNGSFDALLALGPFYHLTDPDQLALAASESARVLRKDGTAFIAVMPRYALLRRMAHRDFERPRLSDSLTVSRLLNEGIFFGAVPDRFTAANAFRVEDVVPFFESHGFETVDLLSSEGACVALSEEAVAQLSADEAAWPRYVQLAIETAHDPSIFGFAGHLLYVGRKL